MRKQKKVIRITEIRKSSTQVSWDRGFQHLINLSCGNVIVSSKSYIQKAFIVTQIQINLLEHQNDTRNIIAKAGRKIVKHENLWLTMYQISILIAHNQDNMDTDNSGKREALL